MEILFSMINEMIYTEVFGLTCTHILLFSPRTPGGGKDKEKLCLNTKTPDEKLSNMRLNCFANDRGAGALRDDLQLKIIDVGND